MLNHHVIHRVKGLTITTHPAIFILELPGEERMAHDTEGPLKERKEKLNQAKKERQLENLKRHVNPKSIMRKPPHFPKGPEAEHNV